jgi:hypothetical protein
MGKRNDERRSEVGAWDVVKVESIRLSQESKVKSQKCII